MKCATASCSSAAEWEVFWPGQTSKMCTPCAERAKGIASAMGFELEVRLLLLQDLPGHEDTG